ncbi:MAG: MBL fold metallo-hydrolase [Thermoplasmata archaeon]
MKISENLDLIDRSIANCYVLRHDGQVILIDTGTKLTGKRIIEYFKSRRQKPDTVLITHYHTDHTGGLKMIYDEFRPTIFAPELEIPIIQGKERPKPANSLISNIIAHAWKADSVENIQPSESMDITYIEPISTPGHTPGSTSYLYRPQNFFFIGDAFSVSSGSAKINRSFTYDIAMAEKSKAKILSMKNMILLPGHGGILRT